jgi:signal transduction protein with GAF and PtsI domain
MAKRKQTTKKGEIDYFAALYDVARMINASLDPSRVLEEIVRCVTNAMGMKACSLRLLAADGERLKLGASYGLSSDYLHKGPILIKESGLDQKVIKGKTILIKNAQTDKQFQYGGKAKAESIKSVLVVPLIIEKRAIGVLRVYSDEICEFDEREIQFVEAVANLSAISIDNARLHENLRIECDLMAAYKYRLDDN